MTKEDKAVLWNLLGKFQRDQWDDLSIGDFAKIGDAMMVVAESIKEEKLR